MNWVRTPVDIENVARKLDREFAREVDGYSGWHEDQPSVSLDDGDETAPYRPAIQQDRREFLRLLEDFAALAATVPSASLLQIGLGLGGGSHFAFEQIFDRVLTLDVSRNNIRRFCARHERAVDDVMITDLTAPPTGESQIILGSSFDTQVQDYVREHYGSFDVCFIDGEHTFDAVLRDWTAFAPLVRPGGYVVFHDHVPAPARLHEQAIDVFLNWLKHQPEAPLRFVEIGHTLGITYYVKDA